jgi:hypothetical protein
MPLIKFNWLFFVAAKKNSYILTMFFLLQKQHLHASQGFFLVFKCNALMLILAKGSLQNLVCLIHGYYVQYVANILISLAGIVAN